MIYTTVESPTYSRADHSAIDCFVTFEHVGRVPFTATASDVEAHSRDIYAKAVAGQFGAVAEYVAPAVPVPEFVTPLQARKALRAANLKTQVDVFIAGLSAVQREEWEYCLQVRRDNALIAAAAASLSLTSADVDGLFRLAATL